MPGRTPINLAPFGFSGVFQCRGSVASSRFDGPRLLFLLGDRHSVKPYAREQLLNVIELCRLRAISCVGVEGRPADESAPFPGDELTQRFEEHKTRSAGDLQATIEGMLRHLRGNDFCFWKLLVLARPLLMQPSLVVESVEDPALYREAARLNAWYCEIRRGVVGEFLRSDDLFDCEGADKAHAAYAKADKQWDEELAAQGVNLRRDAKFIENMLTLWDRAGPDKAAVLYAGTSHHYRIARQLPPGISYYHIEQP